VGLFELLVESQVCGVELVAKVIDLLLALLRDLQSTLGLLLNFKLLMLPLLGILDRKALDLANESELVHCKSLGEAGDL
jgi:uncharacterized membrane protein